MQNVADLESDRIPWEKKTNHHAYQPAGISKETLESAANYLGRGKTADSRAATRPMFCDALQRESKLLIQWAEQQGRLVNAKLIRQTAHAFAQRGTEHEVFFDELSNRFIKVGLTGFGKTPRLTDLRNDFRALPALPSEYIQRFLLYNQVFGDDVRLHGIAEQEGHAYPVISQPAVPGDAPDYRQIVIFMTAEDFRRVGTHEWFRDSDGISVTDANPSNFKINQGGVLPIDVGVTRPEGDLRRVLSHILPSQTPAYWPGAEACQ